MSDVISDGQDVVVADIKAAAFNLDADNRLRVSLPFALFDFNSFQDILFSTLFSYFDSSTTGGTITHNATQRCYDMSCGTASGNFAIAQTKAYWRYQAGKSQLVKQSFVLGAGVAGKTKRIGYFDANDGIFLEQADTVLSLVVRLNGADTSVTQNSWSGDPLNGSGLSGKTLDVTKTQLMQVSFQWLGVASVQIGFFIDGEIIVAHTFHNANILSTVYMASGSLPLRYEIRNTATSTDTTMKFICGSVSSEAGSGLNDAYGNSWTVATPSAGTSVSATETPLIGLRLKTSFLGNTTRGVTYPTSSSILSTSRDVLIRMYYNPTITAGTWSSLNTVSQCEVNTTMTGFSGGRPFLSFVLEASAASGFQQDALSLERLTLNMAGTTSDTLLLTATSLQAGTTAHATLNIKEFLR